MPKYSAIPYDISRLYTSGNVQFDSRALGQMLYQEQKMREQKAAQEDAAVSKMLQDDVGKVRSADVGLVTDMYGKVKEAKMNLMNPKIKQNPQLYSLAQQAHQRAMNNYFTTVRGSQEEKEKDKLLATLKPDERDDNYGNFMAARLKTPLNGLQSFKFNDKVVDLSNPDSFRYMGPNTDWGKVMKDVSGDKRQVYSESKPLDKIGLQSEITPYFYGNSPAQVYAGMLGKIAQHTMGRDAAMEWDRLPKEQYEAVREAYKNIPSDRLRRMGLEKPQELSEYNPDNKAENFARYKAMEYAINNEPEKRTPIYKTNEAVKMQQQQAFAREQLQARFNQQKQLIKERKDLGAGEAKSVMNEQLNDLIASGTKETYRIGDKKESVLSLPLVEDAAKAAMLPGEDVAPNKLYLVNKGDKQVLRRVYFKKIRDDKGRTVGFEKDKDGAYKVDATKTREIPLQQFRNQWAKNLYSGKTLLSEQGAPLDIDYVEPPTDEAAPQTSNSEVENLRSKYGY